MTSPKPYGLHVISGVLTDKDIDRITSVIHRFLSFKDAAQLENLKQVYDLPDGGYFIVQDMGGLFRVLADKQQPEKFRFAHDGLVKNYIPMFFSGVVERATLREGEKVIIKVTEICRRRLQRLVEYTVPKDLALQRFTIDQSPDFPEFIPQTESIVQRTQFYAHNPGWYSGTMAKAIQLIGGYGIQDFESLPDDAIERARFSMPDELNIQLWDKYKDVRLPGYTGLPPANGHFQYDYKWTRTHAIAFDDMNRPWLLQVGAKVYAMPLPVIPLTADPDFHAYAYDELGDDEVIEALETFGALPSGEGFPKDAQTFQRWVRAGVIIEICDTAEFLSHQAFFSACGWSFNSRGDSAYNTGYRYDDKGIAEANTFKLSLQLAATEHHYGLHKVDVGNSTELNDNEKSMLSNYLAQVMAALGNEGDLPVTIKYKMRRIPQSEILNRARAFSIDPETEIDYWDNYRCAPLALHRGRVIKLYSGKLYHHAKPIVQPQIKFPEYQVGLCVSFDFSALERNVSANCDTIMYAYFDDDVLKVVKYFYHAGKFKKQIESDYEQCMTVGSWYRTETTGDSSISGHFYLTDIDDRDEISPTVAHTTIKGVDRGYDSVPFFSFDAFFSRTGTMWRNRYYTHLTKTETTRDKNIELAVLVPMYNRNCVLHGKRITQGNKTTVESLALKSVEDPYSYRYWTHDAVFAWFGSLPKERGKPYPVNGNPVWVEIEQYQPLVACSDFADNGPWVAGMPADYTWLIHPNSNEWKHQGGGGPPKVNAYSKTVTTPVEQNGDLKWIVNDQVITISNKVPDSRYFLPSPDEYGFGMSRAGSKVFLGQTKYANISETNDAGFWKYTGYSNLVNHSRAYHFIGVINE